MKTTILTLVLTISLFGQFDESIFDGEFAWTVPTINILETPFPPGFLNDYSAPGQKLWNSQVNWLLRDNKLSNIIYIPTKESKWKTRNLHHKYFFK